MSETSVLELVDLTTMFDWQVPCSGATHPHNPELHGDPGRPAEYMIQYACTDCPRTGWRPVCAHFGLVTAKSGKVTAVCGNCGVQRPLVQFFRALEPL